MEHQRRPPFTKRLLILAAALGFLAAVLPLNFATAQAPAAVSLLKVSFPGVAVPASTFDLVQSVIDFDPGAASGTSTTTAQSFLSVFEGELTVEVDGEPQVVATGSGIAVPAGAVVSVSNSSSATKARLFVSTLAAVAAVDRLHDPSGAGVDVFGTVRRTMASAPATVDVIQMGARYDVGYRTPNHIMNEFHLMLHLAGQVGYRYLDGGAETYGPGSAGIMYEGRPGWMMNAAQEPSAALWTWLGTPGKPLSSGVAAPAPPATGNAGLAAENDSRPWGVELALVGVIAGLAVTALYLRRGLRAPRP